MPVISQLQIMNDLKAGHRGVALAREYRVNKATIYHLGKGIVRCHGDLSLGFSLLGATRVERV